jgi:copper chaperone CopZ
LASGALLLGLFTWFAYQDAARWYRRQCESRIRDLAGPRLTLKVSGMNCQSCVAKIESALEQLPDVKGSSIDLQAGQVVVAGLVDADTVRSSIESAGFQVDH